MRICITLLYLLFICSCGRELYYSKEVKNWENESPDTSAIEYCVYLIGDAGEPDLVTTEPIFRVLKTELLKDSNSAVVFLGDNIYYNGLPADGHIDRAKMEQKINEQLKIADGYKGKVFFISGNHDWNNMKSGGWEAVKREENYIESYLNRGNTFIPDFGCPGPYKVNLYPGTILIAIDSQWWLEKKEKPKGGDCTASTDEELLVQLEDIIEKNKGRNIIIAAHHPLYSNGNHGGYFSPHDYLFPLGIIRKEGNYIPLPIIGSIYPLFRKFGGTVQDIGSYRYQEYKNGLLKITSKYKNIIYAAGHEHNLQYHYINNLHHIVSGSGSKTNDVKGGDEALFVEKAKGFSKISFYKNGEVWTEFWNTNKDGSKGQVIFRHKLYARKEITPESFCTLSHIDYKDSVKTIAASNHYTRNKIGHWLLGNHYRKEWATSVTISYLDLQHEQGGLIPYAKGGGKQTTSLKLVNLAGKEFVLRTINKDIQRKIPHIWHNTVVEYLLDDQVSAQHPYGALVVPDIAEAVGVYHTNPKLVYIPTDPCLGPYKKEFAGKLMLLEEYPNNNYQEAASLGNVMNTVGTDKMLEQINEDNDNTVDEKAFAKARLLDMLLGDWDRHEKQYRWAEYGTKKGERFIPIPEDRDQVFFKFDGVIPYLLSRKWALRNLQNFGYSYTDIRGLNKSAQSLDRRLLSSLSEKEWIALADSMKLTITDEVIDKAVRNLPEPIVGLDGKTVANKLKSRRDQLPYAAKTYYKILAKYTDIYGSDKNEYFEIERLKGNKTKVTVYKTNKEGEQKGIMYQRLFDGKDTREIRLYGLDGHNVFKVTGKVKKGILVRIIGGQNKDIVIDSSSVIGLGKKTVIYDLKNKDNELITSKETSLKTSNDPAIISPNGDKLYYNYAGPLFTSFYNADDGLFLGPGIAVRKYKFRKNPYGSEHKLIAGYYTGTGSRKIDYTGDVKKIIGDLNLNLRVVDYSPFVMNYFGYGNTSENLHKAVPYNRIYLQSIVVNPSLYKSISSFFNIGLGLKYEYYKLQRHYDTYLYDNYPTRGNDIYRTHQYLGLRAFYKLGTVDNKINPKRGILWNTEATWSKQLLTSNSYYSQYISDLTFYITPNLPFQLTFAGRIGGAMNFGDFQFYQGNTLGMTNYLRGFRKTRFIGDKNFYQNLEVRAELFRFNAYIFPGKFGILAFTDNGRVYSKEDNSQRWHTGFGGGIWVSLFDKVILTPSYEFSSETQFFNFRLGFFY